MGLYSVKENRAKIHAPHACERFRYVCIFPNIATKAWTTKTTAQLKRKKNQKMKTSSVTLVRIMFDWPEARKHV